MKRRTVSLTPDAVDALERLARQHDTTVSCVVEAAAGAIAAGGLDLAPIEQRLVPDRPSGRRNDARRPKENVKRDATS